jgi:hypothetical protein
MFPAALIAALCVNKRRNLNTDWDSRLLIRAEEEKEKTNKFLQSIFLHLEIRGLFKKKNGLVKYN